MKHIKVKTALKAGRITANHARNTLRVRTALKPDGSQPPTLAGR